MHTTTKLYLQPHRFFLYVLNFPVKLFIIAWVGVPSKAIMLCQEEFKDTFSTPPFYVGSGEKKK
jgi:hypothetical protein